MTVGGVAIKYIMHWFWYDVGVNHQKHNIDSVMEGRGQPLNPKLIDSLRGGLEPSNKYLGGNVNHQMHFLGGGGVNNQHQIHNALILGRVHRNHQVTCIGTGREGVELTNPPNTLLRLFVCVLEGWTGDWVNHVVLFRYFVFNGVFAVWRKHWCYFTTNRICNFVLELMQLMYQHLKSFFEVVPAS